MLSITTTLTAPAMPTWGALARARVNVLNILRLEAEGAVDVVLERRRVVLEQVVELGQRDGDVLVGAGAERVGHAGEQPGGPEGVELGAAVDDDSGRRW